MDSQSLLEFASVITKLNMYPYFDIVNYILMALTVRDDSHPPTTGGQLFSRKHPWSSWVATILLCFSSGMIANFLLGQPVIEVFKDHQAVLTASIVWYLINYSPFDFVYKVTKVKPIKLAIYTMKELQRANKVSHGVAHAMKVYPGSYVIVCIVGIVKGAGSSHFQLVQRLLVGIWRPTEHEFINPSFVTKCSLLATVVFIMERKGVIEAPHELVYLLVALFFIYCRLMAILTNFSDPFAPVENFLCSVFMGGMFDAMKRAVKKPEDAATASKNNGVRARKADADKKAD